jgi:DNA (cytosine-5)-methyltransferase 1
VPNTYGVIDLFAGPGGLGEGFAGLSEGGHNPFRIVMSAEMEASAHATLRLRAFVRAYLTEEGALPPGYAEYHVGTAPQPDWAQQCPALWRRAEDEARRLTIGA